MAEGDRGFQVPVEAITHAILELRGQRVILDSELAALYGVPTKALNQAVKRNTERFPDRSDRTRPVTNCDRSPPEPSGPALPALRLHRARCHHGRHDPQ
jgi:hypothetical protein